MGELVELLERTAEPDLLSAAEAHDAGSRLGRFAEEGEERITKLERDLEQARSLHGRIRERLARCA